MSSGAEQPTIARMQTPPGRGGIAVIRVSGPRTGEILSRIFRARSAAAAIGENRLRLGWVVDAGETIDEAVVHMRDGAAEVNIHGGPAVTQAVLQTMAKHGAAVAESQPAATDSFPLSHPRWNNPAIGAELLAALPLVRGERVLESLTHQWSGGISQLVRTIAEHVETESPFGTAQFVGELRSAANGFARMEALLHPREVVLAGAPNAGKSTLANALTGRPISIVHETPGTTRDWVREIALLNQIPVWLTDTAGIRPAACETEAEAIRRANLRIARADLLLLLINDSQNGGQVCPPYESSTGRNVLRLWAKCDTSPPCGDYDVAVSAQTGEGMDALRRKILESLGLADLDPVLPRAFTPRQQSLLTQLADSLGEHDVANAKSLCAALLEQS